MSDEEKEYEVGYKKPPKQHQFRKGEPSRNPKGRKKKSRNFKLLFEEGLKERVRITESGKEKTISVQDAIVRRTLLDAMKGSSKAVERVLKIVPPRSMEEIKIDQDKLIDSLFDLDKLNKEELDALIKIIEKTISSTAKVPVSTFNSTEET